MSSLSQGALIRVLIRQGATIPCGRCRKPLTVDDAVEREHPIPKGIGGADDESNAIISHKHQCHRPHTTGRKFGAEKTVTTANSDIGKIAKVRRLTKAQEESRRRMLARDQGEERPRSKWPKQKMRWRNSFARGK
ncbi:MAG: HNH endonuclease [Bauldia sp.]|nr:HNH endonuclease [Bauldia sp.]